MRPDFNVISPSLLYVTPPIKEMLEHVRVQKKLGKRKVLATGVFDLFHEEHNTYLLKAKQAGDILVVAIESDARTRELKGDDRPVENEQIRLSHIKKLSYVDEAFVLPQDFNNTTRYEELIWHVQPDVYAVSSHSLYQENKKKIIEKFGGKFIVVHEYNPEISTTKIIQRGRKNKHTLQ